MTIAPVHPERNAEVVRRFNGGDTCAAIAESMKLSTSAVEAIVRRARKRGLITRHQRYAISSIERDREVVAAWNGGAVQSDIASRFGVSEYSVYYTLKRCRKRGWHVRDSRDAVPRGKSRGDYVWRPRPGDVPAPLRHEDPHEPMGCRFVYGDPRKEWRYCQQVKPLGSSWCAKHRAIVFRPASVEDEEMAA